MTVKEKKGYKLGHSRNEAYGDSDDGIEHFAKKGCTRVDGNALLSAPTEGWPSGAPMATHYPLFLRQGFVRIDGKWISKSRPVSDFSPSVLTHLFWTEKGHYKMSRSLHAIKLCFSLGMDYEFEVKGEMPRDVAEKLKHHVELLQKEYPNRKVIVKVYNNRPGKAMWLRPFHNVGFPTLITTHTPFRKTDKNAEKYADEYRGFKPRWK